MIKQVQVKSILNKHKMRDEWFLDDYTVNPYSGCSFNCIYCYTKGSRYGTNIEPSLAVKINAPEILEKQLRRRAMKKEYGFIVISSSTDPYIPIEKELKLTRKLLEIVLYYKFPVHIATKSTLVLRDLDLLKEIDEKAILPDDLKPKLDHGVIISFSFSTLDEKTAKIFEPGAPAPHERLETMKKCSDEGFFTGAGFIPVLPFISDSEEQLDKMIKTAKDFGACYIFVGALTLFGKGPTDSKTPYFKALEKYYPELVRKYKRLYRIFPMPPKEYQSNLDEKAVRLCKKHGIHYKIL